MKNKKIIAILVGIVIDQIIKIIVINYQEISIFKGFLTFSYIKNSGAAFGIGSKDNLGIIISNFIILGIVARFMIKQNDRIDKKTSIALLLILSGGISNLIDRILRAGVIDYIKFERINFPMFNLADILVILGFILFAYSLAKQTDEIVRGKEFSHNGEDNSTK